MNGLRFIVNPPVLAADPNRTDIACFVGFVGRRMREGVPAPVPNPILRWLIEQSLVDAKYGLDAAHPATLLNLPAPIDTWEAFDQLFSWDKRPVDGSGQLIDTYLGAAVRSFFAQGGRKCFVVRVGDPWPYLADMTVGGAGLSQPARATIQRAMRIANLLKAIPGYTPPDEIAALLEPLDLLPAPLPFFSPVDRDTWLGAAAVLAAPEASFLCLPDLVDAVAVEPDFIEQPELPVGPEQFVICTSSTEGDASLRSRRPLTAPRCDERGLGEWIRVMSLLRNLIAQWQREVQVVAAMPIPLSGFDIGREIMQRLNTVDSVASAFIQLTYPWAKTAGSARLPEELESPDGVLTGVLARSALARGAFHSVAGSPLGDVSDVVPVLPRADTRLPDRASGDEEKAPTRLIERVSLLGRTSGGLEVLSDVTTASDPSYRPAGVNRLVSLIVRAARRLGEEIVFEPNGEALWAKLTIRLSDLLTALWQESALQGKTAREAFNVRCDRSTMTQNDIDAGRLIALIEFHAAASIELISIVLAINEGGQVSLASRPDLAEAA